MKTLRLMSLRFLTLFALTVLVGLPAHAGSRSVHRLGLYGSIGGDPSPSLMGFNVGYNLTDYFQIHGGYGATVTGLLNGSTVGGGGRFFLPDWSLSPSIGATYSQFKGDLLGLIQTDAVGVVTLQFGLDWQTGYGLYLGIGGSKLVSPSSSSSGMIPYLQLGWFF